MSDSSRLGVSPGHRGPPQRITTVALWKTQWMATRSAAPSQLRRALPNFSVGGEHLPQASKPGWATGLSEHPLAARCLILGLGRSCTSALGNTKTDRERTSRRGDGAYSEKAWTGRGRLQDRDKQKHTTTSARMAHSQKTKGKGLGLPMNPGSEVIITLP